ncbi:sensor histidine kinase [Hespellia stercorisuis]|uniref:histidine kinase n=1 Tax=Hespellia stercorisuis DSM 15480 TaxID=1121950 RepID=A0A1M6UGW3_9FIRM|nr:sensor histidine kinase [Hespellia stercorisuis]SHK68417.1 Histidine kinase-, DNA gyrase B-, and HSP90-like ATPase [Hespellia stercorisuis DSM 15480]
MKKNEDSDQPLWKAYIKEEKYWLGAVAGAVIVFLLMFWLCQLPLTVPAYLACLYLICQSGLFFYRFSQFRKYHEYLENMTGCPETDTLGERLPKDTTVCEADYQKLVLGLLEKKRILTEEQIEKEKEASDYETLWAHQIKVPIAAMRLILQTEECECREELKGKLFEVEGYVEMMLCYQRLGSLHGDLAIHSCELEDIVRKAVHKYARMFIRKKIRLDFPDFHCQILTDEKWLQFVIEQILSNALKYTQAGSVSIRCDCEQKLLTIQDTGIGIAPEDISRVFERGFTGENGRNERTSTGLGLYLCNRIVTELSHELRIDSVQGSGTSVSIRLDNITIL